METVQAVTLGLCEHCGVLVCFANIPTEAMNAQWNCPGCGGILGESSFGWETIDGKPHKVRWVGPEGTWVDDRPDEIFELGNYRVMPRGLGALVL